MSEEYTETFDDFTGGPNDYRIRRRDPPKVLTELKQDPSFMDGLIRQHPDFWKELKHSISEKPRVLSLRETTLITLVFLAEFATISVPITQETFQELLTIRSSIKRPFSLAALMNFHTEPVEKLFLPRHSPLTPLDLDIVLSSYSPLLSDLSYLNLYRVNLNIDIITSLSRISSLKTLILYSAGLNDDLLAHLTRPILYNEKSLANIEHFDVSGTKITTMSLKYLLRFPKLRLLNLSSTYMDHRVCLAALGANWKQLPDYVPAFKIRDSMPHIKVPSDFPGLSACIQSTLLIKPDFDDHLIASIYHQDDLSERFDPSTSISELLFYSDDAPKKEQVDEFTNCKYPYMSRLLHRAYKAYSEFHTTHLVFYRPTVSKRPLIPSKEAPLKLKKPKQDFDSFLNSLM